jgi:hypothetical protein
MSLLLVIFMTFLLHLLPLQCMWKSHKYVKFWLQDVKQRKTWKHGNMEFLLHNAFLLLLNPGKCSHNVVTFHLEYAVLCLVHVFLSDCRVLLIDLLLTGTLGDSR